MPFSKHSEPLEVIETILWKQIFQIAFSGSTTAAALEAFFSHQDYLKYSNEEASLPLTFTNIGDIGDSALGCDHESEQEIQTPVDGYQGSSSGNS